MVLKGYIGTFDPSTISLDKEFYLKFRVGKISPFDYWIP